MVSLKAALFPLPLYSPPFPFTPVDLPCDALSRNRWRKKKFQLSVSNPKSKYVAYLSVLSQFSNCQGLGRKNKLETLKTDRILYHTSNYKHNQHIYIYICIERERSIDRCIHIYVYIYIYMYTHTCMIYVLTNVLYP